MVKFQSIKSRFLISVCGNLIKSIISFISGVIVARGLNPTGYGDLMFLLGSFTAIRSLMDLGISNAFYTFISQSSRNTKFYIFYFALICFQFFTALLLVSILLPNSIIEIVWINHVRSDILLAFLATFIQQQIWQTVGNIGEAKRKTFQVQILNISITLFHLIILIILLNYNLITVKIILWLLIIVYLIASVISYWILRNNKIENGIPESELSFREMINIYWDYCKPLALLSLFGFIYEFTDRWMLQKYGGAEQQGFYQISYQFAAVALLATTSILRVFWKEVAEAYSLNDNKKVAVLYKKVSRGLVMIGAIITGFLIPWAEQIVVFFLGINYLSASPVLAIMLLYPIHQSLGQIGGTMLLATGLTKPYMLLGVISMMMSIPLSYFVQAPPTNIIPGLGLGAMGMAYKVVFLNLLTVNLQAWLISRYNGWRFDWIYQVVGISLILFVGYLSKFLAIDLWTNSDPMEIANISVSIFFSGVFYLISVIVIIILMPWLAGIENKQIRKLFKSFRN
jgi:O-antigen/teichoic acid export membrane protein